MSENIFLVSVEPRPSVMRACTFEQNGIAASLLHRVEGIILFSRWGISLEMVDRMPKPTLFLLNKLACPRLKTLLSSVSEN